MITCCLNISNISEMYHIPFTSEKKQMALVKMFSVTPKLVNDC